MGPVRSGDSADHERQCDLALVSIAVTLAIHSPAHSGLVGWGQQGLRFNINRDRVDEQELHEGDELQVGKFKLVFVFGTGEI